MKTMDIKQKLEIIDAYNSALAKQVNAEERIDAGDRHAGSDHSFALGVQQGIDMALSLMGYALVVDDEDRAVDIEEA